jgi:hypothetical protein
VSAEASNVTSLGPIRALASSLVERLRLGAFAGKLFGGKRDVYKVFGYSKAPTVEQYLAKYGRQDLAARVIDAPPDATWALPPTLINAPPGAIKKFERMVQPLKLWTVMHRVDRLARLGSYSVLLMGFNDRGSLDQPVRNASELLYLRAIGERQLDITKYEDNPRSERFGMPTEYEIEFSDPTTKHIKSVGKLADVKVHHSRIIHVVENPLEDDVKATPIIEKVYNLLDDLLKVSGGSAETFWLIANRGLQFDIDKEMELMPGDQEALDEMVEEYQHQLRRTLKTRGVTVNTLGSEKVDPKNVFEMLMALLSGATGIPQRILIGSEAGQLASEQDRANWAERIQDRRKLFAEPFILCPFVERLMRFGVLTSGEYEFEWPEAFRESPLERAQTMAAKARAVGNLSRQTGNRAPMQVTSRTESREIIGLKGDLKEGDMEMTEADLTMDLADKQVQAAADRASQQKMDDDGGPPQQQE